MVDIIKATAQVAKELKVRPKRIEVTIRPPYVRPDDPMAQMGFFGVVQDRWRQSMRWILFEHVKEMRTSTMARIIAAARPEQWWTPGRSDALKAIKIVQRGGGRKKRLD